MNRRDKAGKREFLLNGLLENLERQLSEKGAIRKLDIKSTVLFYRTQLEAVKRRELEESFEK